MSARVAVKKLSAWAMRCTGSSTGAAVAARHVWLQTLPPESRLIVFLREVEGLSTREVASVVGISEANVKTRLHRARLSLRRQLEAP